MIPSLDGPKQILEFIEKGNLALEICLNLSRAYDGINP